MEFLATVEQLRFSTWVRESGSIWAYPTVLWLHTMGMATVAGISGVIAMRVLGLFSRAPIKPMERLYPLMWAGFALNALTGTALLMADASTKLANWDFYVKMVLVLVGVVVVAKMRKKAFGDQPDSAKGLAWVTLFCWLGAITAGRLLAYVGPVAGLASR